MSSQSINQFGDIVTVAHAAQLTGSTPAAIRQWLQRHNHETYRCGCVILMRLDQVNEYAQRRRKVAL